MNTEDIDRGEVLRYLGYGRHEADQAVVGLVEECIAQLLKEAQSCRLYRECPLILGPGGAVDGGCFQTMSRNPSRNLRDCSQIIVFVITLGTGADHLIQKYNKLQMSKAAIMQAAATATTEEYCDQVYTGTREEYEFGDRHLWSRSSPGYGDFPLDCQQRLLGSLEVDKRIGIKPTDSLLMMPPKLVTAVMGASKRLYRCDVKGREPRGKRDCPYRRRTRDEWES